MEKAARPAAEKPAVCSIAIADPRCRENFPYSHEHRGDQRPDYKTVEPENRHAAKGGDQHNIIWHFGVLTHQEGRRRL